MNKRITYGDLQYSRERFYLEKVKKHYETIKDEYGYIEDKIHKREHEFYNLLGTAVRIDKHPAIDKLIGEITERLGASFPISVFLYQSSVPKAMCTPRLLYDDDEYDQELVILVSQHFFNSLSHEEKISIISHELAHLIYKHANIPTKILLEGRFELEDIGDFKFNLLKWSLCKEITADIFSMYVNALDPKICSNTLIKYNFGFSSLENEGLIDIIIDQYQEMADAVYEKELSTHPLIPLRVKVLHEIANAELLDFIGKEVDISKYQYLIQDFNRRIDDVVEKIYPEIISERIFRGQDVLYKMGVAVALSDSKITQSELEVLNKIVNTSFDPKEYMESITEKLIHQDVEFDLLVSEIILECIELCNKNDYSKHELIPVIRQLIAIAASDGKIEHEELETVFRFAKEFDYSRNEIILLLSGLGF